MNSTYIDTEWLSTCIRYKIVTDTKIIQAKTGRGTRLAEVWCTIDYSLENRSRP